MADLFGTELQVQCANQVVAPGTWCTCHCEGCTSVVLTDGSMLLQQMQFANQVVQVAPSCNSVQQRVAVCKLQCVQCATRCRLQQCAAGGGAGYNWPPGCPQAISHVRPGQQQPAFQFRPPGCTWLHPTCKSAHPLPNIKSCTLHLAAPYKQVCTPGAKYQKLHISHCTLHLAAPTSCKSAHLLVPNTTAVQLHTKSCTLHHVH